MIRDCWYSVGFSAEFPPGDVKGRVVAGRPIVIWRASSGRVAALDARCAHKCFPLWNGRMVANDALECAYHGFTYDQDGRCVAIPALHERGDLIPSSAQLRSFPLVEQDGVVWVWPGDAGRSQLAPPPATPEIGSGDWETVNTDPIEVLANSRLLIENLLDLTHFYPLHAGGLGTYADARVPLQIERSVAGEGDRMLRTIRSRHDFAFGPLKASWFGVERGDNEAVHDLVSPGLFRVYEKGAPTGRLGTEDERGFVLYQTITPVDESHHVWRRSISCRRDGPFPGGSARAFAEAVTNSLWKTLEEDRWALEEQQKIMELPVDGYREVHIRTDGAVVIARSLLAELEAQQSLREGEEGARSDGP